MAPGTAASEERQEHTLRERKTVVRALRSKHLYSLGNFPRCPVSTHLLALSIAVYSSLRASARRKLLCHFQPPLIPILPYLS
ncbi:RIKEN cDNA 1700029M20, isoform CRA_a [Mus musculus]|nr:RIKEN cDNA 1700029M20, isoform CRA_a [Mus musculus]